MLHAICDSQKRLHNIFVSAGQVGDCIGARTLLGCLPMIEWLSGDRGHGANSFREALQDKGIRDCLSAREQRNTPMKQD